MTTNNSEDAKSCFSSILRRLLCGGGLPTHPSSDTTDHNPSSIKELQPPSTTVPAGIVARLMGLDSFPKVSSTLAANGAIIMRKSRSLGSILDLPPNFEITKQQPAHHLHSYTHHRRSVSFREVTTADAAALLHDDLRRSNHIGLAPLIQEKPKNLNNKKRQSQSQRVKVKNEEEKQVPSKSTRKQRGVLNDAKKKVDHNAFPVEEEKKKKTYKSRNRTYNHPLPKMVEKHNREDEKKRSTVKRREYIEYSEEYCMKILVQVCRLTMAEIEGGRGSVWGNNNQNQEQEIISNEISQQILQLLVYEMVDDLIVM